MCMVRHTVSDAALEAEMDESVNVDERGKQHRGNRHHCACKPCGVSLRQPKLLLVREKLGAE